jgi:hypothetical protein
MTGDDDGFDRSWRRTEDWIQASLARVQSGDDCIAFSRMLEIVDSPNLADRREQRHLSRCRRCDSLYAKLERLSDRDGSAGAAGPGASSKKTREFPTIDRDELKKILKDHSAGTGESEGGQQRERDE